MIKVTICEDSQLERELLKNMLSTLLEEMGQENVFQEFSSGEKLQRNYQQGDADIIFMDIKMKQTDGIAAAKAIREKDARVEIVYATSSEEYRKEAFEVYALAYLLKPYDVEKVRNLLAHYLKKNGLESTGLQKQFLSVSMQQKQIMIRQKEIRWLESTGRVVNICCGTQVYKVYARLNDLEKELDSVQFLRCNQSYIVNIAFVEGIIDYDFVLEGDKWIPIRKRDKNDIIQKYYNKYNELHARA